MAIRKKIIIKLEISKRYSRNIWTVNQFTKIIWCSLKVFKECNFMLKIYFHLLRPTFQLEWKKLGWKVFYPRQGSELWTQKYKSHCATNSAMMTWLWKLAVEYFNVGIDEKQDLVKPGFLVYTWSLSFAQIFRKFLSSCQRDKNWCTLWTKLGTERQI